MKHLKILVLFIALHTQAQTFISIGFDPVNAFHKGTVNSKALDIQLRVLRQEDNPVINEIGFMYERFDKLNFESFGILLNKRFTYKRFDFVAGIENIGIHRWNGYLEKELNSDSFFWAYGANFETRYQLNSDWQLSLQLNIRRRTDIGTTMASGFVNLIYKL